MLKKMKEDFRKLKTERLTDAVEVDLKEMKVRVDEILVREKMEAILPMISVSYLAKHYFGKSSSWLYQRINGNKVHGKPAKFTPQELEKLRYALKEISQSIAGVTL